MKAPALQKLKEARLAAAEESKPREKHLREVLRAEAETAELSKADALHKLAVQHDKEVLQQRGSLRT